MFQNQIAVLLHLIALIWNKCSHLNLSAICARTARQLLWGKCLHLLLGSNSLNMAPYPAAHNLNNLNECRNEHLFVSTCVNKLHLLWVFHWKTSVAQEQRKHHVASEMETSNFQTKEKTLLWKTKAVFMTCQPLIGNKGILAIQKDVKKLVFASFSSALVCFTARTDLNTMVICVCAQWSHRI